LIDLLIDLTVLNDVFNVALGIFWAILAPMTNFSDIKSDLTYYRG
jgi:hypothetical protein